MPSTWLLAIQVHRIVMGVKMLLPQKVVVCRGARAWTNFCAKGAHSIQRRLSKQTVLFVGVHTSMCGVSWGQIAIDPFKTSYLLQWHLGLQFCAKHSMNMGCRS